MNSDEKGRKREMGRAGKGSIYSRREKQRGSATRAFPNPGAAKPRGGRPHN